MYLSVVLLSVLSLAIIIWGGRGLRKRGVVLLGVGGGAEMGNSETRGVHRVGHVEQGPIKLGIIGYMGERVHVKNAQRYGL